MKNAKEIDLTMNWKTGMKYLLVAIETHAKKSYFKTDSNGESSKDVIREMLLQCAKIADVGVETLKMERNLAGYKNDPKFQELLKIVEEAK